MGTVSHSSRLRLFDAWNHIDTDDVSVVRDKKEYSIEIEYADGDGDNEAQDQYRIQATVSTREEDAYDLAGGVTDVFGNTLTFATIKQILVYNRSTTDGDDLIVGGNGSPTTGALITDLFPGGTDAGIKVLAGGFFVIAAPYTGYAVTGGSADILRIYNDGVGAITYDLIVKGTR